MSENFLTNKYFVIALIIALIVLLYLYSRKRSCAIEGMKNLNLVGQFNGKESLSVNNINNNNKPKYNDNKYSKENNQNYGTYLEFGGDGYNRISNRRKSTINNIPQPLDMRPDLSQCQPCICPQYSDSDSDYSPARRRSRRHRRRY